MELDKLSIQNHSTIIDGLKQMDKVKRKLLMLFNDDKFINLLTIGDLQRALISGKDVQEKLEHISIGTKMVCSAADSTEYIKRKLKQIRAEYMPLLNDNGDVIDIVFWDDVFKEDIQQSIRLREYPVVLMAGGRGTRLKPITNVIPLAQALI